MIVHTVYSKEKNNQCILSSSTSSIEPHSEQLGQFVRKISCLENAKKSSIKKYIHVYIQFLDKFQKWYQL